MPCRALRSCIANRGPSDRAAAEADGRITLRPAMMKGKIAPDQSRPDAFEPVATR